MYNMYNNTIILLAVLQIIVPTIYCWHQKLSIKSILRNRCKRSGDDSKSSEANYSQTAAATDSTTDISPRVVKTIVVLFIVAMFNPLLFHVTDHLIDYYTYNSHKYYHAEDGNRFPPDWQSYTYRDIRWYFDCIPRSKDLNKALPTLDDWNLLRSTYTAVVDTSKYWDDDPILPTEGYSFDTVVRKVKKKKKKRKKDVEGTLEDGVEVEEEEEEEVEVEEIVAIPPPYYAKQSKGKGRGLFASRNIQKGELVHNGDVSDLIFPGTGSNIAIKWKEFVFSLPRNLACDVTDWHWMQMKFEGDSYHMIGALDISILMNSGGTEFGPDMEPNVLPEDRYSGKQFALRDIMEGEEILTDYDAYYTNWREVGL